jgi:hypothetical protein
MTVRGQVLNYAAGGGVELLGVDVFDVPVLLFEFFLPRRRDLLRFLVPVVVPFVSLVLPLVIEPLVPAVPVVPVPFWVPGFVELGRLFPVPGCGVVWPGVLDWPAVPVPGDPVDCAKANGPIAAARTNVRKVRFIGTPALWFAKMLPDGAGGASGSISVGASKEAGKTCKERGICFEPARLRYLV